MGRHSRLSFGEGCVVFSASSAEGDNKGSNEVPFLLENSNYSFGPKLRHFRVISLSSEPS